MSGALRCLASHGVLVINLNTAGNSAANAATASQQQQQPVVQQQQQPAPHQTGAFKHSGLALGHGRTPKSIKLFFFPTRRFQEAVGERPCSRARLLPRRIRLSRPQRQRRRRQRRRHRRPPRHPRPSSTTPPPPPSQRPPADLSLPQCLASPSPFSKSLLLLPLRTTLTTRAPRHTITTTISSSRRPLHLLPQPLRTAFLRSASRTPSPPQRRLTGILAIGALPNSSSSSSNTGIKTPGGEGGQVLQVPPARLARRRPSAPRRSGPPTAATTTRSAWAPTTTWPSSSSSNSSRRNSTPDLRPHLLAWKNL